MLNSKQTLILSTFAASALVSILLVILEQITDKLSWHVAGTFFATGLIFLFFIKNAIKKTIQQQQRLISDSLQFSIKNSFSEALNDYQTSHARVGENIDNKASELAINSAEVSYFLDQLSHAIELSGSDVDRLASAAEQMSSSIQVMTDNAEVASLQSSKAMTTTAEGSQHLNNNVTVVNKLNNDVVNAAERITRLSQKAAEIQNITNVIDGISGQTNLLALNAAIEAARAGEQGRGFAVVADEVRALASKTAEATEQIGKMLNQINEESQLTTNVMAQVVEQSQNIVESMGNLSVSLSDINQQMSDSANASDHINNALQEQNTTSGEISSAITNLHEFLIAKSKETHLVSDKALGLCQNTESIFIELSAFKTGSLVERMSSLAIASANKVAALFSEKMILNEISQQALFNFNYTEIANTKPQKYHSDFDTLTDKYLPNLQEPLLQNHAEIIYAGAVDVNGYFPTHNLCFSQPLTGETEKDAIHNRTKRIFNDATGIRCGQHTNKFLLQTYKRDTGEIMHDVSAPIIVNGKHWGGFRIGFNAQ